MNCVLFSENFSTDTSFEQKRFVPQVLTHGLFNRLQMWRSIALLKYDLQLHFIHFLPSYEIEMDIWANLKKKK